MDCPDAEMSSSLNFETLTDYQYCTSQKMKPYTYDHQYPHKIKVKTTSFHKHMHKEAKPLHLLY